MGALIGLASVIVTAAIAVGIRHYMQRAGVEKAKPRVLWMIFGLSLLLLVSIVLIKKGY